MVLADSGDRKRAQGPGGRGGRITALTLAVWVAATVPASAELIAPTTPQPARISADDERRAEAAYAEANEAYQRHDLEAALVAAERAFRLMPNASTALIMGFIHAEGNAHRSALASFLVARSLTPGEEELKWIRAGLKKASLAMTPGMGWLVVKTTPPGARVMAGDGHSFVAPLTVGLSAGAHELRVSAPGWEPTTHRLNVVAGEEHRATIELTQTVGGEAKTGPVGKTVQERVWHGEPDRSAPIAVFVSAGALAVGGGAFLIWAEGARRDMEKYASPSGDLSEETRKGRYFDAQTTKRTGETLMWTAWGLSAALAATGAVLWAAETDPQPAAVTTGVGPIKGGALILMGGRF